jgi:hypothetical protein
LNLKLPIKNVSWPTKKEGDVFDPSKMTIDQNQTFAFEIDYSNRKAVVKALRLNK